MRLKFLCILLALFPVAARLPALTAREIFVAPTGDDAAAGTAEAPIRTINHAAQVAQPGDIVTVRGGTYREWVRPVRGGASDRQRIVYRAAPGEQVVIKGSERITTWQPLGGGVWKAALPNEMFGDYNPYQLTLSGGWLLYGQWHHRGDVYLNGEALLEQKTLEEVKAQPGTWCCSVDERWTTIWANFAKADPNEALTEINVRQSVFMPERSGLDYITVDGFHLMHSAENWEPPGLPLQMGMIGPRMGKGWVIQNCHVTHARCVGIILGRARGVNYADINAYGDHIVRNNVIRRCGQAGIAGQNGATRCLVSNNLIEDTNYRREFGGWETAAIKFHQSVDAVIRNNLIRRVRHRSHGAFGIWMDWGNQAVRISGNIIYDTDTAGIFLEMDHGPILVDNNVVVGGGVRSNSEATVLAHNLFVDCPIQWVTDRRRASPFYKAHTSIPVGRRPGLHRDDQWYYNVFVGRGLDRVPEAPGLASDYNVFLQGAQKSRFGDEHSVVVDEDASFSVDEQPRGVTIRFKLPPSAAALSGPWVDSKLVGIFQTVGQTIEDRHGRPIRVDTDLAGSPRQRPLPGPLASLPDGSGTITWPVSD